MRRTLAAVLLLLAAAPPAAAEEIDYDSLNEATQDAIKTACHGWIFLDAANWIAEWFDAVSPLCDAEKQARLRALQPPQPEPVRRAPVSNGGAPTDFRGGDPWGFVRIECDNEYMCVKQRIRAIEAGRTVSMDEYNRIAAKCEGDYWCIEQAFDKLPDLEIPPPAPQQSGAVETAPEEPEEPEEKEKAAEADAQKLHTASAVQPPAAPVEVRQRLPDSGPAVMSAAETGALFSAEASISGVAPENIEVHVAYTNHAPVALNLGPVLFDMACSDGRRGLAWAGGAAWVMPGERVTLVTGAETIHGQSCPGGLAVATPAGPIRHLQKGVSGYEEQSARCAASRTVPLVFFMAPRDGRHYRFLTGDGRQVPVDPARYDARRVLGNLCDAAPALHARQGGSDYVAGENLYLSHDYRNFMDAWTAECARAGVDCAAAYQAWTAERP